MTRRLPRVGAALALAVAALLTTACSAPADASPEPTSNVTSPAPEPSTSEEPAAPEPEPSDTPAAEPTCETIIDPTTVADFESINWTYREDPFYAASIELPDGLVCVWADFEGPAGDHLQMFGWAPITNDQAIAAQHELISQGWIREDATEGVYVTESPDTAIAVDENGYGMTFLFGDGAVKLADTKQGLLLINWPRN